MPRNYSKNRVKFFLTIVQIVLFIFIIVYAGQLWRGNEVYNVSKSFVAMGDWDSYVINPNEIATVELNGQDQWVIQYLIQPWDSLSKIASMFWTTISHIQKINNLWSSPIRPGEKLVITDDEEWIIYDLPEKTNVLVFANKYNLNVEDFMTMNSLQDETEILQKDQELFLPISQERAYDIGLLIKPEPVPEPIKKYIPTIHKPSNKPGKIIVKNPTNNSNNSPSTDTSPVTKAKVSSKRVFNKKVSNGFAPWNCTWYVAAVMPQIFPYTDEDTQSRPFGWNARDRYKNAKAAWYKVWQTPRAWSIIVYSQLRSSAWHVWVVDKYDSESWELTIRDMNYAWKYIVTKRTDSSDNSKIVWYIYP